MKTTDMPATMYEPISRAERIVKAFKHMCWLASHEVYHPEKPFVIGNYYVMMDPLEDSKNRHVTMMYSVSSASASSMADSISLRYTSWLKKITLIIPEPFNRLMGRCFVDIDEHGKLSYAVSITGVPDLSTNPIIAAMASLAHIPMGYDATLAEHNLYWLSNARKAQFPCDMGVHGAHEYGFILSDVYFDPFDHTLSLQKPVVFEDLI